MPDRDLTRTPLGALRVADLAPRDRVAPNFLVYELSVSELADRRGIDNRIVDDTVLRSAVHLARTILQPIRDAFGGYTPNSVYRGQALERSLKNKPAGWISTSQHTEGRAADIEIVGMATIELARWVAEHLKGKFDQVICECHDPRKGPNSGWVHVSTLPPGTGTNRGQVLSYVVDKSSNRLVYVQGLEAIA